MAITEISTDYGIFPRMVRIRTTDDFTAITANGYITTQALNIAAINFGAFEWTPNDFCAIVYANGKGFFSPDYMINHTFVPLTTGSGGGFTWVDVTKGSANASASTGYMADSTSLTTITLPTSPNFGDTYRVVNVNTGGWKIVYGAGQQIQFGDSLTTISTGSLASGDAGAEITITAKSPALFYAYAPQGNLVGT